METQDLIIIGAGAAGLIVKITPVLLHPRKIG